MARKILAPKNDDGTVHEYIMMNFKVYSPIILGNLYFGCWYQITHYDKSDFGWLTLQTRQYKLIKL